MATSSEPIFFVEAGPGQTLDAYLDQVEETWNKRIDRDVSTLGDGLGLLVKDLEKTSTPTPHITSTSSLSVSVRTHHLIEAAESLSALTHQLKLWVVLSDEDAKKKRKDDELERVSKELEEARREVAELLAADGGKT